MERTQRFTTQACSASSALPAFAAALTLLVGSAHAGSIKYEFTDGSLAATVTGLPAGVTASDFSIGSFPGGTLQSDALRLTGANIGTNSTATSLTNNTVLSFSLTIPSGVTLSLASITFDYTSSGLDGKFLYARTYSSIDGLDEVVNDTIGLFGKATAEPASATGVTISLEDPLSNLLVGSNVTAADFTDLTDQTITFYMPMIRRNDVAATDYIQFDNITLNLVSEPVAGGGFALTITPAEAPDTGFNLEWDSQTGKLYNLRTSTDLVGAIADWTLVAGGEVIAATPPTNSFNVDADVARRFFAVEEFDAPPPAPLLSEDFETDDGGFTVATVEGTDWERGAPDSFGPGGTVNAGNGGSANAWATNLGTFSSAGGSPTDDEKGIYINPTETALRSPVLDLTSAAGAELTFAQAMDFPVTDIAVVNLINATTDDIIAQIHVSEDPNINNDASWANVGPIDLAAGLGQQVRIEWRFTGTGGTTSDFMGWYIDDVLVTETTP